MNDDENIQGLRLMRLSLSDELNGIRWLLDYQPVKPDNIVGRLSLLRRLDNLQKEIHKIDRMINKIREQYYYEKFSN